jgi:aminoglycoside 3-N-acetyltransferase
MPAFDPETSSARRDFGRFPERLRTWPGALRSTHPEVSFTAIGPQAPRLLSASEEEDVPGKRHRSYRMPTRAGLREFTTIDTFYGVLPYVEEHPVGQLAAQALEARAGTRSMIGRADVHVFAARQTAGAVVAYLEERF